MVHGQRRRLEGVAHAPRVGGHLRRPERRAARRRRRVLRVHPLRQGARHHVRRRQRLRAEDRRRQRVPDHVSRRPPRGEADGAPPRAVDVRVGQRASSCRTRCSTGRSTGSHPDAPRRHQPRDARARGETVRAAFDVAWRTTAPSRCTREVDDPARLHHDLPLFSRGGASGAVGGGEGDGDPDARAQALLRSSSTHTSRTTSTRGWPRGRRVRRHRPLVRDDVVERSPRCTLCTRTSHFYFAFEVIIDLRRLPARSRRQMGYIVAVLLAGVDRGRSRCSSRRGSSTRSRSAASPCASTSTSS